MNWTLDSTIVRVTLWLVAGFLGIAAVSGGCARGRDRAPLAQRMGPVIPAPVDVADRLEPIRAREELPALAAAVIRGEHVVALGAVGVRKLGATEPVTVSDRFHLGSDTKAMTATLIALLVEQGRLAWSTTLAEAFPELRETMDPAYRDVTLEQLLQHRGGIAADLLRDGLFVRLRQGQGTLREQRQMLVETVLRWPPAVPPGEQFLYSNAGYVIAGVMAERVTGELWEDLMRQRLFEPLGMTSAGFGAPGRPDIVDEPRGHNAGWLRATAVEPGPGADNPPALGPAGTVHCALLDWAKFVSLHLRGESEATGFLKPETFVRLHTLAPRGEYAMGWGVSQHPREGRVLLHAGSNTLWFVQAWLVPEQKYAILVATNVGGDRAEHATGVAIEDLIAWVHERPVPAPPR